MGKRGPARRPTTLRLIEGARPDKVNQNEPKPRPVAPEEPEERAELGEASEQHVVWTRVVEQLDAMGLAFASDTDSLVAYVEAVVIHRQISRVLSASDSLIITGDKGAQVKHPGLQVQRDAAATIRAYGQEFGLTPSARASVRVDAPTLDAGNPFAPATE